MRLSETMSPALTWSEAVLLPARTRTLSGGAALGQLRSLRGVDTARVPEEESTPPARGAEDRALRRAAYRQVIRLF